MELLEKAESNISEHGNGRLIYQKFVTPAIISLEAVGAHYAMSSLFDEYPFIISVYAYDVEQRNVPERRGRPFKNSCRKD